MDLREFYLSTVSEQEYYHVFYDFIKGINEVNNVFAGAVEKYDYTFSIDGIEDAIEKFRYLCQPENEYHNDEEKCWFYLILFYLKKCGYIIEEFPRLIEHPPRDSYDFVNKEIRNKIISEGKDDNGTVRYVMRRKLIADLTFLQTDTHIELIDAVEQNSRGFLIGMRLFNA